MPVTLPLLLCGPVLRRVTPRLVSVWVAVREPGTVRLDVYQGNVDVGSTAGAMAATTAPTVISATAATARIAANLHLALPVAELIAPAAPLQPGTIYSYNLTWTPGSGATAAATDLRSLGLLADDPPDAAPAGPPPPLTFNQRRALGYQPGWLPSFATVPTALTDLKIVHGSCNKLHGYGKALLPQVDDVISDSRTDPLKRPHQLFLTGDQIYADDVADCLLPVLDDLAQALMGENYQEQVTVDGAGAVTVGPATMPAGRRMKLVCGTGGLTTEDGSSHLVSFGEFAALYLLTWSPQCWPPKTLAVIDWPDDPGPADQDLQQLWQQVKADRDKGVAADPQVRQVLGTGEVDNPDLAKLLTPFPLAATGAPAASPDLPVAKVKEALADARRRFLDDKAAVTDAAADIWKVARALANVPTYAICDDHEVTDDWYMTAGWRTRVLGNGLGKAIVRNGVTAYVLFQGWGNQPHEYATTAPFSSMLQAAAGLFPESASQGPAAAAVSTVEGLLGFDGSDPKLKFHYTVDGSAHRVLVMDSRTRRAYSTPDAPPALLSPQAMADQIPAAPLPAGLQMLLLVSPAPVLGPSIIDEIAQPLGVSATDVRYLVWWKNKDRTDAEFLTGRDRSKPTGSEDLDVEGWAANPACREQLLAKLAPYQKVVILAGDVHYGATIAMTYTVPGQSSARIINFTASAVHNAWAPAVTGFFKSMSWVNALQRIGLPATQLGWTQASPPVVDASSDHAAMRGRAFRSPVLLPTAGWAGQHPLNRPPDWLWSIDLIQDTRAMADRFEHTVDRQKGAPPDLVGPDLPPFPADGSSIEAIDPPAGQQGYGPIAARHGLSVGRMWYSRGLLYANNVSLVEFSLDDSGQLQVSQTLYSLRPNAEQGEDPSGYTRHVASLAATPLPVPTSVGPS
jgi:hypothetical protein